MVGNQLMRCDYDRCRHARTGRRISATPVRNEKWLYRYTIGCASVLTERGHAWELLISLAS